MNPFVPRTFEIPELSGISKKTVEEHLKLYQGYVKFANQIQTTMTELGGDVEKNAYVLGELQRRFSFEFDGMRNHEIYFESLEGGPKPLPSGSSLAVAIDTAWGSFDAMLTNLKRVALTRGIGWAMLSYDAPSQQLALFWVDEQHLGHGLGTHPIVAIDMWEHSYLFDFVPADKKKYVEAYLANYNWETAAQRFEKAVGR